MDFGSVLNDVRDSPAVRAVRRNSSESVHKWAFRKPGWENLMKWIITVCCCIGFAGFADAQARREPLTLEDCLDIALEQNQNRALSRLSVEVADARRGQANSTFWPQVGLTSSFTRMDDHPTFVFPESTSGYSISDFLANPIDVTVTVPELDVQLLNKTDFRSSVDFTLPLYTGGKRRGIVKQASAGVDAAEQGARKTDLQLRYDVKRYYYGGVLAGKMVQTAEDAVARLQVTLDLTEGMYKRGSGKVTKADYLKHKIVFESARSVLITIREQEALAHTALVNVLGFPWETEIELAEKELPFEHQVFHLEQLVGCAYASNPDWFRVAAGLKAAEGKIREAKSERRPNLALLGRFDYIINDYDAGVVGPGQKRNWMVGIGMQMPLFTGFRTNGETREARALKERLDVQKGLLQEGLAVQVKIIHRTIVRTQEQEIAARAALDAAIANRELNVRAYQDQLVEVEDVVQAQLMESFAVAQYEKVRYDQVEAVADLEKIIGAPLSEIISN